MINNQAGEIKTFGDFFRNKRIELGLSLRNFCKRYNYDPGNISRIERNLLPPTLDDKKLAGYAKALKIDKDSEEWVMFHDLAHTTHGMLPKDIKENEEISSMLPAFFRTMRNKKINKEKLEKLIELLRR